MATNRLTEIGGGVALGDVDGDGWVDVYLCRAEGDNALYRNQGNWAFEDLTTRSGVACSDQISTGAVLADLDGDGDLDLLVNSLGGGTQLFLNDGQGRFTESVEAGLVRGTGATSMALADVDGDGDLDLYVTNYRSDTFQDRPAGVTVRTRTLPDGTPVVEPRDRFVGIRMPGGGMNAVERGQMDYFYLNRGSAKFVVAPWNVGVFLDDQGKTLVEPLTDWGLSVIFRDFNGDGLPDLYICNDFVYWPDRIWLNAGGRRFQAPARTAFRNGSLSSMSVDVADINRDGFDDLFVADMLSPRRQNRAWQRPDTLDGAVIWPVEDPLFRPEVTRNTLHLARGDGSFAEIAQLAGVAATDWTWSSAFLDVDLDGWEDLLLTTGSHHELQDMDDNVAMGKGGLANSHAERLRQVQSKPRRATPSLALRNRRDLTFEDMSAAWGFGQMGVAHGMAMGDLDNDGDLDVVINALNEEARILRNDSKAPRIALRLKAAGGNTRGVSARMTVRGGPVVQSQEMIAGGRYLSGDDAMRVFATGSAEMLTLEVAWRSGRRTVVNSALPNRVYELREDASTPVPARVAPVVSETLFEEFPKPLKHVHVDQTFNDFERDALLPYKLSRLGPGVAVADVDGDGDDDLVIGGGTEGRTAIYRNDGTGVWTEWEEAPIPKANRRDTTGVVLLATDQSVRFLAGESAWEDGKTNAPNLVSYVLSTASKVPTNARVEAAGGILPGPLALADVDGDGELDVFIGGQFLPGRYPESSPSILLRGRGGGWQPMQIFGALGAVSGAIFSDLDRDGDPDLILACAWGPVRILQNDGGRLKEVTAAMGLVSELGWWNGVATGDFDGDDRMDFVVSNWGRNWRNDQPMDGDAAVELAYGDFGGNGRIASVMGSLDRELGAVAPWRERRVMSMAIPSLPDRFPTYRSYATATVVAALGPMAASARHLKATEFRSMVFLNRDQRFEMRPLPIEAQFAPAFGVSVADFDGDGHEDVFLAQNFFGHDKETSRQDAGMGLVLLGTGMGEFRAVWNPASSGIGVPGEQRGTAVGDFDSDGRPDLVVTQNGGSTKVFRNRGGKPGVRVRVNASVTNPWGIGARVRVKSGGRFGLAREIQAGGGYWSQSSAQPCWPTFGEPTAVEIRWPGGQVQEFDWPPGARSVLVDHRGAHPGSKSAE